MSRDRKTVPIRKLLDSEFKNLELAQTYPAPSTGCVRRLVIGLCNYIFKNHAIFLNIHVIYSSNWIELVGNNNELME